MILSEIASLFGPFSMQFFFPITLLKGFPEGHSLSNSHKLKFLHQALLSEEPC